MSLKKGTYGTLDDIKKSILPESFSKYIKKFIKYGFIGTIFFMIWYTNYIIKIE